VLAMVVVVINKIGNGRLQVSRHLVRYLVYLLLDTLMVPLQLTVGLGMEGRGQNVMDSHQG
jgi:hypothetical protein